MGSRLMDGQVPDSIGGVSLLISPDEPLDFVPQLVGQGDEKRIITQDGCLAANIEPRLLEHAEQMLCTGLERACGEILPLDLAQRPPH